MGLVKVIYTDNVTVITAQNLNDIQDAIIALEESGISITVDDALSSSSENPVQNKVITLALSGKADSSAIPTDVVKYVSQSLTNAQKTQARSNIGALASNQGSANADKFLKVGSGGDVSPADLPSGNNIWTTTEDPMIAGSSYVFTTSLLAGRSGVSPLVGDLIIGSSADVYQITTVNSSTVAAAFIESIKGATGPTGGTGATGPAGPGVPTGGTTGQFLVKQSSTNYDAAWVTLATWQAGSY